MDQSPERVVIAGLVAFDGSRIVAEEHLEELTKLVETAGGTAVATLVQERPSPDPATYFGKGKAEELRDLVAAKEAKLVIVDDEISPAQARNLQAITNVEVIDRSALILDIFARNARSRESRTQVELAQLSYMLPRLTRQWSHLSRQAGGIGTRGVGETQLELDRRIVRTRIAKLRDELAKIEQTRDTQRKGRKDVFTIALVGYTNAGKSTLFNRLTQGSAEAADRLFATLDAKVQKVAFETPRPTIVADTVGFIRKLPHHLVASFRSTMAEATEADLVLHVVNSGHPHFEEQVDVGNAVLEDLGVDAGNILVVYNKADLPTERRRFPREGRSITISALNGTGMDSLVEAIRARELAGGQVLHLRIPMEQSKTIAKLYEVAQIREEQSTDHYMSFVAWVPSEQAYLFAGFERLPDSGDVAAAAS